MKIEYKEELDRANNAIKRNVPKLQRIIDDISDGTIGLDTIKSIKSQLIGVVKDIKAPVTTYVVIDDDFDDHNDYEDFWACSNDYCEL